MWACCALLSGYESRSGCTNGTPPMAPFQQVASSAKVLFFTNLFVYSKLYRVVLSFGDIIIHYTFFYKCNYIFVLVFTKLLPSEPATDLPQDLLPVSLWFYFVWVTVNFWPHSYVINCNSHMKTRIYQRIIYTLDTSYVILCFKSIVSCVLFLESFSYLFFLI